MARALLLGAGLVAAPLVRYLGEHHITLTIAANNPQRARELLGTLPGTVVDWQSDDSATLTRLVADCDVAISLLPATMHLMVARACLAAHKPMVTASYVSPEMAALDQEAKSVGVPLLNELGVDPGIDHMSAMKLIDQLRAGGGEIRSFRSYCGGLPAPDANDNPWGYKFSWSPAGVLRAASAGARYLQDGAVKTTAPEQLFRDHHELVVPPLGSLEAYPNRDSLSYIETYGLQGIQTMYRGTLRWPGWCETLDAVKRLGLLTAKLGGAQSWGALFASLHPGSAPLKQRLAQALGLAEDSAVLGRFDWLGLLDEATPLEPGVDNALEALAALMSERMAFGAQQRDMLVMHHAITVCYAEGREERWTSSLVDYGIPGGDTSMARTVGLPVAIAAKLVLEKKIDKPGVQIPVTKELYQPILAELARAGIALKERLQEDG